MTGNLNLKLFLAAAVLCAFIGPLQSQITNCYLNTGSGCSNISIFTYSYKGLSPNNQQQSCRRMYNLQIAPLPSFAQGVHCNLYTRDPYRYSYSFSHSSTPFTPSTSGSASTPIIYAYYRAARIYPQRITNTASIYRYNFHYHREFHSQSYSRVSYRFHTDKLYAYSSNTRHRMGSLYYFKPKTRTLYVGLNHLYESTSNSRRGSGLCRIYCRVVTSFQSPQALQSFDNDGDTGGSDGGLDDISG